MSDKKAKLQHDTGAILYGLKTQIDRIKIARVMEDTDRAEYEFTQALSTIIAACAITISGNITYPPGVSPYDDTDESESV